jgi:hypothetical protein
MNSNFKVRTVLNLIIVVLGLQIVPAKAQNLRRRFSLEYLLPMKAGEDFVVNSYGSEIYPAEPVYISKRVGDRFIYVAVEIVSIESRARVWIRPRGEAHAELEAVSPMRLLSEKHPRAPGIFPKDRVAMKNAQELSLGTVATGLDSGGILVEWDQEPGKLYQLDPNDVFKPNCQLPLVAGARTMAL